MINFKKFNSVISLTSYFTSDDKCKQAIIESRWGVGIVKDFNCFFNNFAEITFKSAQIIRSKTLFAPIVVNIIVRCPKMDVSIAQGAIRTFLALLVLSSRIPSCHLSSGS